ncbi:MAG: HD domain-containing phosphohydrolase [Fimbriimonadaceae bacterium]
MSPAALREYLNRLEAHARGEAAHGERVAVLSTAISDAMGFDGDQLIEIRFASALHDIGKLLIDSAILSLPGPLSGEHILGIRRHCTLAAEVLGSELSPSAVSWILSHHERWDGAGYPDQLAAETIPRVSQIISIAEAYDSMTSPGGYRPPISEANALEEIRRCAGTQFDPAVAHAFFEVQPLIQPLHRSL